jgi:hypothetical protein
MVTKIMDNNGIQQQQYYARLLNTCGENMTLTVDDNRFRQPVGHVNSVLSQEENSALEASDTMEELLHAVKKWKSYKAPDKDVISQDFFKYTWDIIQHDMLKIVNQMYTEGKITQRDARPDSMRTEETETHQA